MRGDVEQGAETDEPVRGVGALLTKRFCIVPSAWQKQLPEQSKGLAAINRRLAEFGTEHAGVWVYGSDDDEERQYRRLISNA